MDLRHDLALPIATSIAVVVTFLLTWAACHWWYGRKLVAAAQRLHRSDKERAFSREQTVQARKQVEQLKAELAARPRVVVPAPAAAARSRDVEHAQAREVIERMRETDSAIVPIVAAQGFADTQVLPD